MEVNWKRFARRPFRNGRDFMELPRIVLLQIVRFCMNLPSPQPSGQNLNHAAAMG
jgi:hypothetical protein